MFLKILGFLFVFLESCQQVGFNGGDSRIFWPKLWENFTKSTWSLNINLRHYFFHNRALSSRSCPHSEELNYSAHSWATGTCHTNHFEMEMAIEIEMCSWDGKLATQVEVLLNLLWLGTLNTRPWQLQPCIHNINLLQQL